MKKTNGFVPSLLGTILATAALGCGGGGGDNGQEPPPVVCPAGTTLDNASLSCRSNTTDTNTTTATATQTATQTSTATSTTTATATNTGTSTWVPNADCNTIAKTTEAASAKKQVGLWPVNGWNICITAVSTNPMSIEVVGYGYKASELAAGYNTQNNLPPSLVKYAGVMGGLCVLVEPVTVNSEGPSLQGNGVVGNRDIGFTISDGTTTASWTNNLGYNACPFDRDLLPCIPSIGGCGV